MNELLPPAALDAEANALGAMLLSPKAIEAVTDVDLSAQMFYRLSHGDIFKSILSLYTKGEPVDAVTVVGELGRHGRLDTVTEEVVYEIASSAISQSNAKHYANIVREKWLLRELADAGRDIHQRAMEGAGSVEELYAEADARFLGLTTKLEGKRETVYTGKQLVDLFRERLNSDDSGSGIETPFTLLPPWKSSRLYVVGGYQGDGKSVFGVQALRSACEDGARVGFATLEMSHQDLTDRLVATFGVPLGRIASRDVSGFDDIVEDALGQIEQWDFEIIDDEEMDPGSIGRAQRRGKYDLLIIDHLHRMRYDRRHQRASVGENVIRINNIARKFEIPVILLAQLRRGPAHDPFPRPTMADFRETSEIESEAAMAIFVWRLRDKGERTSDAELIVGKNRFGAEGYTNLRFRESQVKFTEPIGER